MGDPGIFAERIGSYFPILTEMFSESVLTMSPRFYYFYASSDDVIREEAAYGGLVSLTTGWWQDFLRMGFSGATSQALYTPDGRGGTGLLQAGRPRILDTGRNVYGSKFRRPVLRERVSPGTESSVFQPERQPDDSEGPRSLHRDLRRDSRPLLWRCPTSPRSKNRISDDFLSLSEVAGAEGTDRGATLAGFRYHWREDQSNIGAMNAAGWDTFNTLYAESTHQLGSAGRLRFQRSPPSSPTSRVSETNWSETSRPGPSAGKRR